MTLASKPAQLSALAPDDASTVGGFAAVVRSGLRRHRGLAAAIVVFGVVFGGLNLVLVKPFGYYDFAATLGNTTPLAIGAMGATLAVIVGGLDLSAGAVISLSNCLIVRGMSAAPGWELAWTLAGLAAGCLAGVVNGLFIGYLRLQPIVVTLATMFIIQGATLLIMPEPGGEVPPGYSSALSGDAVPGLVPTPLVILVGLLLLWGLLRRTRFGVALYAIGSDEEAARANGVDSARVKFTAYVIAGGTYGVAGVFLTAQTGSADPLVGPPMLLPIFVAVVLGGTPLDGGRGGCLGTVFGAFTLMLTVNVLLVMNVSAFLSTAAQGLLLVLAVLGSSLGRDATIWRHLRTLIASWRRTGIGLDAGATRRQEVAAAVGQPPPRRDDELPGSPWRAWLVRHGGMLRLVLPAYAALAVVLVVTALALGRQLTFPAYLNSLLVLASFPAVIVLGQGVVILCGGLDMSIPWMITFAGILFAGMSGSANGAMLWTAPTVLAVAAAVGFVNGIGIVGLGISPIVMTLAMNGVLQAAALIYCNGAPIGLAPPGLRWLMAGKLGGVTPIVWLLAGFVVGSTLLLSRTTFGRRLYAVGNGLRVARFAGVPVGRILIFAYMVSSLCAALVGLMLTGFGFQATLEMGDAFLLPSIAAAVVGGTLITGGRGHYLGMFGGALLLTALSTLLSGLLLPAAVRSIIFGGVLLVAVVALRERAPA